jgi:hypothetical protein
MKIEIIGDFLSSTGYASHTRQLTNALYNEGIDIALTTNLQPGWERMVNDNELKMIMNSKDKLDYRLMITLPTMTPLYWNDNVPILQYVIWEGDKIPKGWINILDEDRIKYILVPSTHTKNAIINTPDVTNKLLDKIKIVPHGVNINLFKFNPIPHKSFTFLSNKGWPQGSKDRGGLSFLLKAYMEEFTSKDNVNLLVKINSAYGMNQDLLNKNMAEIKIENKDPSKLSFILDNVPYEKLTEFYNSGDVYIISSLAESFCIPGLEAMACGVPVLSTDFGG